MKASGKLMGNHLLFGSPRSLNFSAQTVDGKIPYTKNVQCVCLHSIFPFPMRAYIIWNLVANVTQVLYAKSEFVPPNFVAIGDSVMQSNPAYGYGATKACVGAVTLAGLLAKIRSSMEIPAPFALLFFRKQHMRTGWTWDGAKMGDYVFDSTEPCEGEKKGHNALPAKLMVSWLRVCEKVGQLLYLGEIPSEELLQDPLAAASFLHARMFLYPTTSAMTFRVRLKVLLYHYTGYLI